MKFIPFHKQLALAGCLLLTANLAIAQNLPNVNSGYPAGTVTPLLPANFASGVKVNSVRSIAPSLPVLTESAIVTTDPTQSKVNTQYLDGLGRVIQTVNHFATPNQNDLVTLTKYDNFGRDAWHFLPYAKAEATATDNGKFKLTAFSDQKNFYKTDLGYAQDNYFYTQTKYEASPLNRVTTQLPQGNSWVGSNRGKSIQEYPYTASAQIFTIGYAPGSLPVSPGVYGQGELMTKLTRDEDGNSVFEITNKDNQLVLKITNSFFNPLLSTYYVYDDFGQLRYVIPPKATTWLAANNWTMNATIAAELCFSYEYDGRLRNIIKTTPGAGASYTVYNLKDQPVFSQTPTQRAKGEWLFTKYDVLGRIIQTGVYNSTANLTVMQNTLASATYTGTDPLLVYMFKDIYGNAAYVNTFTTAKVYTTNYYDDYSFTTRTYNAGYMASLQEGWNTSVTAETTNLLTGTKTLVLNGDATPMELLSVNYYNDRGLLLQSQVQNHKGGWSTITNSYDFTGQKLGTYTEIKNPGATDNATIKTVENFYYDHAGRLLADYHDLNDMGGQIAIGNTYDELGRLANKNTSPNGTEPTVEYEYNVRGWLTGINKSYCHDPSTRSQTFGMELSYNYGYTTNYYNGNIAGIKWRNSGKAIELRSYGYTYDIHNRLKSADFALKLRELNYPSGWSNTQLDYTASNMNYDENGNLASMKHMGLNVGGQKIVLDNLAYGYYTNSNRIQKIDELAGSQSINPTTYDKLGDFRDVASATDYTYDASGNLLTDANKSLSFVHDEVINKTKRVTKGSQNVDYLYDAAGNKLQKKVSGGTTTVTDYIGNAVYNNNSLNFMSLPEGRIRYNGTAATKYMYDFFIKDHLGSTRSVITYTEGNITGNFAQAAKKSEEVVYLATSEIENAAKENQLFDNVETTRSTKPLNKTATDNYVAKISSKNNKTILGPDITLKVMAQDTVKISAEALYLPETINRTDQVAKNVINSFVTAFTTLPSLAAEGITTVTNSSSNELATAILNMQQRATAADAPRAYLNYVLYDEHMKLIPGASGALQVKNKEGWQTLETGQIVIPQNGFLRVFSNNMETAPVSINNTLVGVIPGKLVEEYNYYPYGLVFDQTQAAGVIKKTDYLYNGKELQHNEFGAGNGLELEDYGARMYDPQIGRWTQIDPMSKKYERWTPYNYVLGNPIKLIDPDGREVKQQGGGDEEKSMSVSLRAMTSSKVNQHASRAAEYAKQAVGGSVSVGVGIKPGVQIGPVKMSGGASLYNTKVSGDGTGLKTNGNVAEVSASIGVGNTVFGVAGSVGNWDSKNGLGEGLATKSSANIKANGSETNMSVGASNNGNTSIGISTGILSLSAYLNPVAIAISLYESVSAVVEAKAAEIKMQMNPYENIVPDSKK